MRVLAERRWAILMLLAETAALWVMLNIKGVPLAVCAAAILGSMLGLSLRLSSFRVVVVCTLLSGYMYLRSNAIPLQVGQASYTFNAFGPMLAQYSMLVQLTLLFWKREGGVTIVFGLFGGIVMMCAGDHSPRGYEYPVFQAMVAVFMVCLALMTADFRIRRRLAGVRRNGAVAVVVALVVAVALSVTSSFGFYRYQNELDAAIMNMAYPIEDLGGVRLKSEVRLGSVAKAQNEGRTRVALRIESEEAPGYLRANVFDSYFAEEWTSSAEMRDARVVESDNGEGRRTYVMDALTSLGQPVHGMRRRTIWPEPEADSDVFTQLGSAFVEVNSLALKADGHGTAYAADRRQGSPYTLLMDPEKRGAPMPEELRKVYLEVPRSAGPEFEEVAREIFADAATPEEKSFELVKFFAENFSYEIGVQIPSNEEPLSYFMRERPAAHCEFFASSAVVLLRMGGVPTRYVTGFVALEKNSSGGYWMARSRDAHAWAEMWDGEHWVVVEATPAAGVPLNGVETESDHAGDALRLKWQQWREAVMSGRAYRAVTGAIRSAFTWLSGFVRSPLGVAIIGAAVALLALRSWLRRGRAERKATAELDELGVLLRAMERWLAEQGRVREASETLSRFADRLAESDMDEVAAWYREYVALRYDPGHVSDERIAELERRYRELAAATAVR